MLQLLFFAPAVTERQKGRLENRTLSLVLQGQMFMASNQFNLGFFKNGARFSHESPSISIILTLKNAW